MKRSAYALILVAVLLLGSFVAACGTDDSTSAQAPDASPVDDNPMAGVELGQSDWGDVCLDPDAYKGATATVVGRVFSIEKDSGGLAVQMFVDAENSEQNTVVWIYGEVPGLSQDDYLRVKGTVEGVLEGENAFGAQVTAPIVSADETEIVDAMAMAPEAVRTVTIKKGVDHHGVIVRITKVEFAEDETRVYLTVVNRSGETASFYSFNAKAVQGGRQFSAESMLSSLSYPEVDSEIVSGARSTGVVVLPAMNPSRATKLIFEASNDNYMLDFAPYVFQIPGD